MATLVTDQFCFNDYFDNGVQSKYHPKHCKAPSTAKICGIECKLATKSAAHKMVTAAKT